MEVLAIVTSTFVAAILAEFKSLSHLFHLRPFSFFWKYSFAYALFALHWLQLFLTLQNQQPSWSLQYQRGIDGRGLRLALPIKVNPVHLCPAVGAVSVVYKERHSMVTA